MKKYAAIVLAAGASKRLGKPKQLLPYQNSTLLNHCIQELLNLNTVDVYVVLGAYADAILLTVHQLKVTTILNTDWEKGMGSSLSAGITEMQKKGNYDGVIVSLSDLPFIDTKHYKKLISTFESGRGLTLTDYPNCKGVPCMIGRQYFSELKNLTGNEGAKPLMQKYKKEVSKVTSETSYFDIDTYESYQKLIDLS